MGNHRSCNYSSQIIDKNIPLLLSVRNEAQKILPKVIFAIVQEYCNPVCVKCKNEYLGSCCPYCDLKVGERQYSHGNYCEYELQCDWENICKHSDAKGCQCNGKCCIYCFRPIFSTSGDDERLIAHWMEVISKNHGSCTSKTPGVMSLSTHSSPMVVWGSMFKDVNNDIQWKDSTSLADNLGKGSIIALYKQGILGEWKYRITIQKNTNCPN